MISTVSTLALAVVGFSVPTLGETGIISNTTIFGLSMIVLAVVSIYSLWYLAIGVQKSIIARADGHINRMESLFAIRDVKEAQESGTEPSNEAKAKVKSLSTPLPDKPGSLTHDRTVYRILGGFTVGLILLVLSMIHFGPTVSNSISPQTEKHMPHSKGPHPRIIE